MKLLVFGAALLGFAIPAFGQVDTTLAPAGTMSPTGPAVPGACEAAFVSPGVPTAIVVLTVPTPAAHAGGVVGSARPFGMPSGWTPAYPGSTNGSPSNAPGVIGGGGTLSGIGTMSTSGIGTMRSSGVGSMERSGIGSIGSSNVGSFGPSPGLATSPAPSSSPFIAPSISQTVPGAGGNPVIHRREVRTQVLPFICP